MKFFTVVLLCAALFLAHFGMSAQAYDPLVNDDYVREVDTSVFIERNGRPFFPVRLLAETFGIFTAWDHTTKTAVLERGMTKASVAVGSNVMVLSINGAESTVDMGAGGIPVIVNGRVCMPIEAFLDAFELTAIWHTHNEFELDGDISSHKLVPLWDDLIVILPLWVKITDGYKELLVELGSNKWEVRFGYHLEFYMSGDLRFAYPRVPPPPPLNPYSDKQASIAIGHAEPHEGNIIIVFFHDPRGVPDLMFTVTSEPADGMPFADLKLESVISHISTVYMEDVSYEHTMIDGVPAVAYNFAPEARYPTSGVALFHNGKLFRFEVRTATLRRNFHGAITDEMGIDMANIMLHDMLPSIKLFASE